MNKFIIITSIFNPTKAVCNFAKLKNYQLIVVGDKKTPKNWSCKNVVYLSVEKQLQQKYLILKKLPYNHYCRKMVGYLYAIENGADIIIDTDDDNLPIKNWRFPEFSGIFNTTSFNKEFLNVYNFYSRLKIWPRGFPLEDILSQPSKTDIKSLSKKTESKIGVWQGLVNGDPDVDAIYRLTINQLNPFFDNTPLVLEKGTVCPFNSQNTAFRKELFPLLYLPSFVTFRFTDILRGLIAQPLMWNEGYKLGFTSASAIQDRNVHDYLVDFESEIPCYLYAKKSFKIAQNSIREKDSLLDNIFNVYLELEKNKIVNNKEIGLLDLWLNDLSQL